MKPCYIIISAFGSYAEETIIHFEKEGIEQGLFLITGDTGAGKTTIFDAITYALYGECSGKKRSGEMMRSQFAKMDRQTFVEYVFIYKGNRYKITRWPKQVRPSKKKKNGKIAVIEENARVELVLPDETIFKGKKPETDKKIIEILGLNLEQFTQVAMIAQGDFLKLLHVSSRERKEIFERIFNTKIYGYIEEELKDQFKEVEKKIAVQKQDIEAGLKRIRCIADSRYIEKWKEFIDFSEGNLEQALDFVEEIIIETKNKEKVLDALQKEKQQELDRILSEIQQVQEINQLFDKLDEEKLERAELDKKHLYIEETEDKIEKINRARKIKEKEAIYLLKEKEAKNSDKRIKQSEQWLSENSLLLKDKENEKQEAENYYTENHSKTLIEINTLQEALPKYQVLQQSLKAEKKLLKEQKDKQEIYQDKQKKYENTQERYQKTAEKYESLYHNFLQEQADILAEDLVEGQPCPVCGSTTHPRKVNDIVNKQKTEINLQTELIQENNDLLKQLRTELKVYTIEKEKVNEDLIEIEKQLHSIQLEIQNLKINLIYEKQEDAQKQLQTLKEKLENLENNKTKQIQEYQDFLIVINEKKGILKSEKEFKNRIVLEKEQANQVFLEEITAQGFENAEQYHEALKTETELESLKKECQEYREKVLLNTDRIENYKEQTKGKERKQTEDLEIKKKQAEAEKKYLEEEDKEIFSIYQNNQSIYQNLKDSYYARKNEIENYKLLKRLSDTANGNLSNRHIDFQTYMQRRYFKVIITQANKRLMKMSHGQFLLQCRKMEEISGRAESGLELDVYSIVNDKIRDVKTLSGGESFMAALAMALGMADVIQNTAGSICIDTVFIDEGFGSLSEETREQAIAILNELSGGKRLVGIISHVTELKAQIETKLVVTKSKTGSKVKWEK